MLGGRVGAMPRVARVVIAEVAHHVTQRGNGRQFILATDGERLVYLDLLRQAVRVHSLSVLGYCLMSNHVHAVVVPRRAEGLAEAFHQVHGRYASYWNVSHASCGHVWQGRFYSCPMDPGPPLDGLALCGAESGARGDGGGGGRMALVQRRRPLRKRRPRRLPGHVHLAPALVRSELSQVLGGG